MALWRYTAIALEPPPGPGRRAPTPSSGELAADSAAAVRASLRRIGLQAIEVKPIGQRRQFAQFRPALGTIEQRVQGYLRSRRRLQRAEIYDSLATMLTSGLPLLEAVEALLHSAHHGRRLTRLMLSGLKEQLRAGGSLGQAMREQPSWFDSAEVAIVEAGQHSGNLHQVLASLAERHERSGELGQRLMSALTYPFIVLLVGLGVGVFLSVQTLPQLVKILQDAKVPVPALTTKVMWVGSVLSAYWWMLLMVPIFVIFVLAFGAKLMRHMSWQAPPVFGKLRRLRPRVIRTMAVGGLSLRLAELIRSGVPIVEALRIIAPTTRHTSLRVKLIRAADCVERGDELSDALDDQHWFDTEFRRLLDIGQTSGELDRMLSRIGERYQRQARRLIDRLAALLEPVVILGLAVFVGLVVMSAILPLLRLQEIL